MKAIQEIIPKYYTKFLEWYANCNDNDRTIDLIRCYWYSKDGVKIIRFGVVFDELMATTDGKKWKIVNDETPLAVTLFRNAVLDLLDAANHKEPLLAVGKLLELAAKLPPSCRDNAIKSIKNITYETKKDVGKRDYITYWGVKIVHEGHCMFVDHEGSCRLSEIDEFTEDQQKIMKFLEKKYSN